MIEIRTMTTDQWPDVARLIHDSTNAWYLNHGMPACFAHGPESTLLFCQVYESLDPGCCFVAVDPDSGQIVGSCFWHPRPTHISLGIMNVHPENFGRKIATRMLQAITEIADQQKLPVRLVSSAMNLDSFSLYNRAGFVPETVFQDMLIRIDDRVIKMGGEVVDGSVRPAADSDIDGIVRLEQELLGVRREKDIRMFVRNVSGIWHTLVHETPNAELDGYLVAVRHPASNMIGPGAARSESTMLAMTGQMLSFHRDNTAVMLVSASARLLSRSLGQWGARNCDLHLSQVRGKTALPAGIIIPSFMPETG